MPACVQQGIDIPKVARQIHNYRFNDQLEQKGIIIHSCVSDTYVRMCVYMYCMAAVHPLPRRRVVD